MSDECCARTREECERENTKEYEKLLQYKQLLDDFMDAESEMTEKELIYLYIKLIKEK